MIDLLAGPTGAGEDADRYVDHEDQADTLVDRRYRPWVGRPRERRVAHVPVDVERRRHDPWRYRDRAVDWVP